MATYVDGVKRKEDKTGMELYSHIVYMSIIKGWSKSLNYLDREFGPPHYYAHINYVTITIIIIVQSQCNVSFPFYTFPIYGHSHFLFTCIYKYMWKFCSSQGILILTGEVKRGVSFKLT